VMTLKLLGESVAMLEFHNVVSDGQVMVLWHLPGNLLLCSCLPSSDKVVNG
jgi:hypothetical protein